LGSGNLKASEIVKFGGGLIGLNQASGWVRKLKRGEDLSNPVLVMLWKILIERNSVGFKPDVTVPERRVVAKWVDTREAVGGSGGYYKGSDRERLDRIEQALKERGLL
jgi:hypothetical protein